MSIVVLPQTVISLSEFLESYGLTLLVRQTGASKWEASFEPEVLEDLEDGDDIRSPLTIQGGSSQEAVDAMCSFLSGTDGLSVLQEDRGTLLDLDLYYTKVENDWNGVEKEPGTPSLLKSALRHHGGE